MSLLNNLQIMYAPDDGPAGGIPPSASGPQATPRGVSPTAKKLENILSELNDSNRRLHSMLMKTLGVQGAAPETSGSEEDTSRAQTLTEAIQEGILGPLKDVFNVESMLAPLFGDDGLSGILGLSQKEKPKERPKLTDMLKLPAEHSLGYALLYWKLDEIAGLLDGKRKSGQEEKGKGIGGFFSGLLKGAGAIALLAGGMLLFAGALLIFSQIEGSDWAKALFGIGMFALFVVGAVAVAKYINAFKGDFVGFAQGVLLLTASMILFGGAIWVMAQVRPYIPDAIEGIALFGMFVAGAVVLAKVIQSNMEDFVQFGVGTLLLVAGLGLFAGAIYLMNWAQPYIPGAIDGIALFGLFGLGAVALAKLLGSQLAGFAQFAAGTILMTAGLVLFAGAVWLTNRLVSIDELLHAGIVAGAMAGFVVIMGALGYAIMPLLPGIALIAVGAIALSVGVLAFGLAVRATSNLELEDIAYASTALQAMSRLGRDAGMLGLTLALALPGLAILSIAAGALMVGMVAMSAAIRTVGTTAQYLPTAIPALSQMMRFLSNPDALTGTGQSITRVSGQDPGVLEILTLVGEGVLLRLAGFGLALIPFSIGMQRFAQTIHQVSEIGDIIPAGLRGLQKMMLFLSNPEGGVDANGDPIGTGYPGVLQLIDTVTGPVMARLGIFGLALMPFTEGMRRFADVIRLVAAIGDPNLVNTAIEGIGNMIGFLVGGGPANIAQSDSVVGMMDHMSLRVAIRLAAFGAAIGPLSSALLDFAHVVDFVSQMDNKIANAIPGLRLMFAFLAGPEPWSVTSMVRNVDANLSRNVGRFGAALEPFSSGMLLFTGVVERVGALIGSGEGDEASPLGRAIAGIRQMVSFLVDAGEAVQGVASGGFLGLGRSSLERFGAALDPFATGMNTFIGLTQQIAGNEENVESSARMLNTMVQMLTAAGAVERRGGSPQRVGQFKDSLTLLGDGIERFHGQVRGTQAFVLNRIADALERIAQIQFGQMFTPFIAFMEDNEQLKETATQLERINDAITPRAPTTLDRISGAIGSIFNRGGDRAALNDTEVAAYMAPAQVDGSMEGYVAGMYDILSRWDQNPMALPGGGDTNMMLVQTWRATQGNTGFGGGNF